MSLGGTIDKVIAVLKAAVMPDYTNCKGIYDGDQLAYSAYPVICVGVPSLLDEDFPVIAQHSARDEEYTIEIVTYVQFEDTSANAREIITLTDSVRAALRADMKPPLHPLGGYCYEGEIDESKFVFGAKGDVLLRVGVTLVKYIKRI